jgi:Flp pilus assembly pilin Flp
MHTRVPRRGATMVEYALMLMLISITSLLVVSALGTRVATSYDTANQPMATVTAGPTPPSMDTGANGDTGAATGPGGGSATAAKPGNNGRHGNPGQGNGGNGKSVGNAPSNRGGGKKP